MTNISSFSTLRFTDVAKRTETSQMPHQAEWPPPSVVWRHCHLDSELSLDKTLSAFLALSIISDEEMIEGDESRIWGMMMKD